MTFEPKPSKYETLSDLFRNITKEQQLKKLESSEVHVLPEFKTARQVHESYKGKFSNPQTKISGFFRKASELLEDSEVRSDQSSSKSSEDMSVKKDFKSLFGDESDDEHNYKRSMESVEKHDDKHERSPKEKHRRRSSSDRKEHQHKKRSYSSDRREDKKRIKEDTSKENSKKKEPDSAQRHKNEYYKEKTNYGDYKQHFGDNLKEAGTPLRDWEEEKKESKPERPESDWEEEENNETLMNMEKMIEAHKKEDAYQQEINSGQGKVENFNDQNEKEENFKSDLIDFKNKDRPEALHRQEVSTPDEDSNSKNDRFEEIIRRTKPKEVNKPHNISASLHNTHDNRKKPKLKKVEIGGLVVKLLTPAYAERRFESRDIFKTLARNISHALADKDENEIKEYVKRFLEKNEEITARTTL